MRAVTRGNKLQNHVSRHDRADAGSGIPTAFDIMKYLCDNSCGFNLHLRADCDRPRDNRRHTAPVQPFDNNRELSGNITGIRETPFTCPLNPAHRGRRSKSNSLCLESSPGCFRSVVIHRGLLLQIPVIRTSHDALTYVSHNSQPIRKLRSRRSGSRDV